MRLSRKTYSIRAIALQVQIGDRAGNAAQSSHEPVRALKLSPVEAPPAQIARHVGRNDAVNATTCTQFEKAMREARDSEARWMNGTAGRREGVTCARKDRRHEAGMIVTAGSVLLQDAVRDCTGHACRADLRCSAIFDQTTHCVARRTSLFRVSRRAGRRRVALTAHLTSLLDLAEL